MIFAPAWRKVAVDRHFTSLLVNTLVGFTGPEYLYDGKQLGLLTLR